MGSLFGNSHCIFGSNAENDHIQNKTVCERVEIGNNENVILNGFWFFALFDLWKAVFILMCNSVGELPTSKV